MIFRNLDAGLSSDLIRNATEETYRQWIIRYGELPPERLRTEIGVREVKSANPGYCYMCAGWEKGKVLHRKTGQLIDEIHNGKLFLYAPVRQG